MQLKRSAFFAISAFVCLCTQGGRSEEREVSVSPPELVIASADGKMIEIRYVVEIPVYETRTRNNETVQIITMVAETRIMRSRPDLFEVERIDGSAVSSEELVKELAKPTAVLLFRNKSDLDPRVRRLFKPEILVMKDLARKMGILTENVPAATSLPSIQQAK